MNDFKPLHIVFCPGGAIYEDGVRMGVYSNDFHAEEKVESLERQGCLWCLKQGHVMEKYVPESSKDGPLTTSEARNLFYLILHELDTNPGLHHAARKALESAEFKLQQMVWPDQCGEWGCCGEHGANECKTDRNLKPGTDHWAEKEEA